MKEEPKGTEIRDCFDPAVQYLEIQIPPTKLKREESPSELTEPDERPQNSNRHPLLAPNVPCRHEAVFLMPTIHLEVLGYDGYTLSVPRFANTEFGDDWELLNLLAGSGRYPAPANIKKPYIRENIKNSLEHVISFQNALWFSETVQARNEALFDFKHPLKRSIPQQMIRYNNILVGHCVLIPGKKATGTDHIAEGHEYVKPCFFLASNHRRRGVLFAALKALLQIAVEHFGVTMVYAEADTSNTAATSLLYKLMDWSELQWGGMGTTGDSTIHIEHRYTSGQDYFPPEIEIRPAVQWAWPIGAFGRGVFSKSCKPSDDYERTTWHGEWKKGFDLKNPELEECTVDTDRNTPWDPAKVISDVSFRYGLPSKSTKQVQGLAGIRVSGRNRRDSSRNKEASMNN